MATINNLKGTTYQSFLIGKRGTTVYQGPDVPVNVVSSPSNGDIYLQKGLSTSDQGIWQYVNSAWVQLQVTNTNLSDISKISKTANTIIGIDSTGESITALSPTQVEKILGLGSAAYVSTGTSAGNVPVLDAGGKIPVSTLPSIAINDVYSVANIDARDALNAHEGDIAIVTSTSTSYIYDGATWQAIGSAGSVTGIEGANSTVKTGVVRLDASDILSGTLTVPQGGTGLTSVTAGDLIVGSDTNTLETLAKGSDGSALVMSGGSVKWGKTDGSNVTFSAGTSGLSSSNVTSAINEVATSRAKITLVTSDPWSGADTAAGFKIGDIIVNTTTNKIFQAISVATGAAVWQKMGTTVSPENTIYVAFSGDDTNGDGSASFPYKTVSKALNKASSGTVVLVFPGSYNEDISVVTSDVVIKSMSGNVTIGGAFTTSSDNVTVSGIDFAVINSSRPSVTIGANSNIVFKNCSMDASTTVSLSGKVGTGVSFIASEIFGSLTMNSTSTNPVVLRDSYGFGLTMTAGTLVITSARSIRAVNHTGGSLYLNDVMEIVKNADGYSIVSSAVTNDANFLHISNTTLLQSDKTYGGISITGGTSYLVDDVVFDPATTLPETGRIYGTLSKDIGVQGTFTNFVPGANVQTALSAIDAKLGSISSAAITTFTRLSDVDSYSASDANKVVQVNPTGTGVTYGQILGTAASKATTDFATAAQGNLASTAVQPGDLSTVATSGKFVDLTDGPGAMGTTNASKVLRVNASGTALEFGPTLAKVANTGNYADLNNLPTFAKVASTGSYADLTGTPALAAVATSGAYEDLSGKPVLSTIALSGKIQDATGIPAFTVDDAGQSLVVNKTGDGFSLEVLATVATSGSYNDLSDKPTLSAVATSGKYSDLTGTPALSTVATTGKYSDLSGKPVLGTASENNTGDFATAAQGAKADTAVQPSSLASVATTGFFTSLGDCPHTMTSEDVGKVLRVSSTGNSIEYGPVLSTVASSGKYTDLTDTPSFSDGSIDLKVKSIDSDKSNILSDGNGNLNIVGKLTTGSFILPSSKYEDVSSTPTIGQLQLITNGRKPGESAGAGTGVLCIFDGKNWMDVSSGTTVII